MCTEMTGRILTFIRYRRKKMDLLYPDYNSENEGMILNDPKEEQEGK